MSSKVAAGKLRLLAPHPLVPCLLERYDLRALHLEATVACAAAALPFVHRDPFDRVIVALAQTHGLTVLTSNHNIPNYAGVKTLW